MFQTQTNKYQLLNSLILSLQVISDIDRDTLVNVLAEYSVNPKEYLKRLKAREYLTPDYSLTQTSHDLVKGLQIEILSKSKKGNLQVNHTNLIFKSLLSVLFNLDHLNIKSITREKSLNESLQPDLIIELKDGSNIFIESETGSQSKSIVENKLKHYSTSINNQDIVIIFTNDFNKLENINLLYGQLLTFKIDCKKPLSEQLQKIEKKQTGDGVNSNTLSPVREYKVLSLEDRKALYKSIISL